MQGAKNAGMQLGHSIPHHTPPHRGGGGGRLHAGAELVVKDIGVRRHGGEGRFCSVLRDEKNEGFELGVCTETNRIVVQVQNHQMQHQPHNVVTARV